MNFVLEIGEYFKKSFNEEQLDYVVDQYFNKNVGMNRIAKIFGCSPQVVERGMLSRGLNPRGVGEGNRKYSINHSYFQKIDTEDKAYWLGFLYADGCVTEDKHQIKIALSSVDEHHLEKFIKSTDATYPIARTTDIKWGNEYYGSVVRITSKEMTKDLVNLGCVQNKTKVLKFPTENQVPSELIFHFIRGYFDGDGSINFSKSKTNRRNYSMSVAGTQDIIENFKSHLNLTAKMSVYENYSTIATQKRETITVSLDKLYKGSTIYLDRKYEKYLEMLTWFDENPPTSWNKGLKYNHKERKQKRMRMEND